MNGTKRLVHAFAIVLGLAAVTACSDDEPGEESNGGEDGGGGGNGGDNRPKQGSPSSCDLKADLGYCLDFGADAPAGIARINCDGANEALDIAGIVSAPGSCPAEERVGTCIATISGVETTYRYYSPSFKTSDAEQNCAALPGTGSSGGVFTPN